MSTLVELSPSLHGDVKIASNSSLLFAAKQHLLSLRVQEVGHAVCNFPVFLTKNIQTGYWNLSAVTSFELGANLFVSNNQWAAIFQPTSMQTYPFYLMNSVIHDGSYTIGIDENSPALSKASGQTLFEKNGKGSLYLARIKSLLEADITNDINTYQFGAFLADLGLCQAINVLVRYQDDSVQTLAGLHTINEDKLNSLSTDELKKLNDNGYLAPIYAMLVSINQLNALIQKNNQYAENKVIKNIKIEINRT